MYVKPSYKVADWLTIGGVFETGFNNYNDKKVLPVVGGGLFNGVWTGDANHYFYAGNAVITLPWSPMGITISLNPEVGYEHYSSGVTFNYGAVSDTYWDVGLDFNYKAVTLDLRYWDINVSPNAAVTAAAPLGTINAVRFWVAPISAANASSPRSSSTPRCRRLNKPTRPIYKTRRAAVP